MIAVAEVASSHSHAASGGSAATKPTERYGVQYSALLRPLHLSLWAAWGLLTVLPSAAQAQIIADPNAPGGQRPTITNASNGVPLVNIQTPSAAGVSRNTYSQFDVQKQGAILNNSREAVSTQLGGYVQANPWLSGGSARIILNEVNSSNPSFLRGYIEVAGSRAQVVVANPAGVTCDGCGFINANRATLTTGTPILNGGNLDGYRVTQGAVTIQGDGLKAEQADYTDIIARTVVVNAGIWANDLKVTVGANQVNTDHTQVSPIAGTGLAPTIGIDVAQLGGMYAGKITLIGTEAGVGVRNAGTLGASAGNITITNDGYLQNTGNISASANTQLSTTQTLTNRGYIDGQDTRIQADTVDNLGTGLIYGDNVSIAANTLNNAAENANAPALAARNRMDLGVQTLNNSEHALIFSVGDIAIGGALDSNNRATGQATTVNNASATIEALGSIDINASQINNTNEHYSTLDVVKPSTAVTEYQPSGSGSRYTSPQAHVDYSSGISCQANGEANCLVSPEGQTEDYNQYNYTRTITQTEVQSSDPARILAGGNINITANTLTNDKSQIVAGGALNIAAVTLNNIDATGTHTTHEAGNVTHYYRIQKKGRDDQGADNAAYLPADTILSINLGVTKLDANTAPTGTGTNVPNNSLFSTNPNPAGGYLIETDPRFANYRQWLSSAYMQQQLAFAPEITQKRLGDGFYEQKILREQLAQLTGKRFLDGYENDEAQYMALMNNGITAAEKFHLQPGIALSADQIAALTSDMVWLEERSVKLPNGETALALVPQLYVRPQARDLNTAGGLLAGNSVNLNLTGDLNNRGSIAGRSIVNLAAANINNLGGQIQSDAVHLAATTDINNQGGSITAFDNMALSAGRDIKAESTTRTQASSQGSRTNIDRVAGLYVLRDSTSIASQGEMSGQLVASAGRDINLNAANVFNDLIETNPTAAGPETRPGVTLLMAANNINLGTITESATQSIAWNGNNYRKDSSRTEVGSTISTRGDTQLVASESINTRGTALSSTDTLTLSANSIILSTAEKNQTFDEAHQHTTKGFLSKKTVSNRDALDETIQQGSTLSANRIALNATQDLTLHGSRVEATNEATLTAGRDINVVAAENVSIESHSKEVSRSGLVGNFRNGFSIGKSNNQDKVTGTSTTAVSSTVSGSNVQMDATRNVAITGSQVLADQDINVTAGQNISLDSAYNRTDSQSNSTSSKTTTLGLQANLAGSMTIYGTNKSMQQGEGHIASAVTTLLSANSGNLTLNAGNSTPHDATISSQGADLLAGKTITLEGDRIDLQAAANTVASKSHSESKSFTIGAKPAGYLGSLLNQIGERALAAYEGSGNKRLDNAMALKTGYDTYKVLADQAEYAKKIREVAENGKNASEGNDGAAFGVSVTVGSSKSESNSSLASSQALGTNLQAKNIVLTARETDIRLEGAKLQAENISLDSARNVVLLAAANTSSITSDNKSSSLSAGVTFGFGSQNGISFQLGAQNAKGMSNGNETTYDNTLITATDHLSVKSGSDTTLKGAQLAAKQVTMNVGRNLNIETLQDSSRYESEQKSGGFGISICVPPICYGTSSFSVNASNQEIKHNYRSAVGQSGIAAGDGGFDIAVGKNTDLVGAAITSTASAANNRLSTQSLTSRDLDNEQSTSAKSQSISVSASYNATGAGASALSQVAKNGAVNALGNMAGQAGMPKNGSEQSQTLSVISPSQITITGTDTTSQATADLLTSRDPKTANKSLKNTLTLQQTAQLEKDLKTARQNAEAAQLAGTVMAGAIGDIAKSQTKGYEDAALEKQKNQYLLTQETDPDKRAVLQDKIQTAEATMAANKEQYDMWKEGSPAKIALHGLAGFLQGRVSGGNAGAATFAAMTNEALTAVVNEAINKSVMDSIPEGKVLSLAEQKALNKSIDATKKNYGEAAAILIGSLAGAVVGGKEGAAIGGTVALIADQNNRQLHQSEYNTAKKYAAQIAKKLTASEGREVTEAEAEGRIAREILRNVDFATSQKDGKRDEAIVSLMGCQLLKCDAYKTDSHYYDSAYNSDLIAANQSTYDKALAQSSRGLTAQQIIDRNNAAGAPVAKAGAAIFGAYVLAPAAAALVSEGRLFAALGPRAYCGLFPANCIIAADTIATTATGTPQSGITIPGASGVTKVLTQEEKVAVQALKPLYEKAPAAKEEIDTLAKIIATEYGGTVAKAPLKSIERAAEKVASADYGGDVSRIKDIARNTIVVDESLIADVTANLKAKGASVREISSLADPLGYSGVNTAIKTKSGLTAEIQVNSPEMIYAKETESVARTILGNAQYDELAAKIKITGGMGHTYYEQWRVMDNANSAAAKAIAEKSKAYYTAIREAAHGK